MGEQEGKKTIINMAFFMSDSHQFEMKLTASFPKNR